MLNMKIYFTFLFCLTVWLCHSQQVEYICHHQDIAVFPLEKLNTKSIEFSPMYYQQGLVYVVAREKNSLLDPKTGRAYFDLLYADIGPDGSTTKSVNFSPNIKTQYHEGPCSFSMDGKEIYFTRSNLSGTKGIDDEKGNVQLKIYSAVKGAEDWEQITALPFCNDAYATAHPALSPDGQWLVFASDMPGGLGGMDLYIVQREDGVWSNTVVNLGPGVNTGGNELFPFWHQDGYLIFSSNGRPGEGGLDLYVTAQDTAGSFFGLQHLAAPFNSKRDDLGMIISADGMSGYLASDRKPTMGKDDLYRWTSPRSIFCQPGKKGMQLHREITFINKDQEPLEQTKFWLIPMDKEGPSRLKEHFNTELVPHQENDGEFFLRWSVTDTLSDETADAIADTQGKIQTTVDGPTTYILVARKAGYTPFTQVMTGDEVPANIILNRDAGIKKPCLGTSFIVYDATGDLQLNGAKVEISGTCLSGAEIKYTDESGMATSCLPTSCPLKAEVTQNGYAVHSFVFTPSEDGEIWKVYLKESQENTPTSPIASGTVIVLDNIYYDFNKSAIRKGDAGELNALADILKKYPDLTIELTSHTDTRGSAEYNLELSEKRSASSKEYLVLLGINGDRIVTKAAGESTPRNKCVDGVTCSEAEHQYNRRTEVRIINPAQGMQIKYKAEE
jgi:outer membrane protein OmpA-like peptidoglycan-associated protein